jgi:hypothetical protein
MEKRAREEATRPREFTKARKAAAGEEEATKTEQQKRQQPKKHAFY